MVETSKRRLQVFLCYAAADRLMVRSLYEQLAKAGADVWLDEENLLPGQDWQIEIPKAVRASDIVVICLSKNSVTTEGYVQREIKLALDCAEEKPDGRIFVIPVCLETCTVPERLRRWQSVNMFDTGGYDRLIGALTLRAIEIGAKPPFSTRSTASPTAKVDDSFKEKRPDGSFNRVDVEQLLRGRERAQGNRSLLPSTRLVLIVVSILAILLFISTPWIRNYLPSLTLHPTVSILNLSNNNNPINTDYAPYEVFVNGNVSNAKGNYLYLIVDDGKIAWVQNPLGLITSNNQRFEGKAFLGAGPNDPPAQNKLYVIYAVISNSGLYKEHDDFKGQPLLATSNQINVTRRDGTTPVP